MDANFFENWTNQLRKGLLELCIMNDIRNRKMYGYEIVRRIRETKGLIMSEGAIYPILSRLKRQRLVETFLLESPDGPTRKHYKLTKQGEKMIAQMNSYWQGISDGTNSIKKG